MTFHRARILTVVVLASLGCHQRSPSTQDEFPPLPAVISIRVENRNLLDVMIYVEHSGTRTRVGLAPAVTNTEFTLSLATLGAGGDYRLIGDPIGMRVNVYTEALHARPGDQVTWLLEDDFARSTVVVR